MSRKAAGGALGLGRRQLLQQAIAMALAAGVSSRGALAALAESLPAAVAVDRKTVDDWKAAFHAALARDPSLVGWLGTQQDELVSGPLQVRGRIPEALHGTLYRNGAARHEIGDYRYRHWFDGDGMVQAFHLGPGPVSHHGRFVATSKYRQERAAGRALFPAFGSTPPDARPVSSPDSINPANISMLAHAGRLYALWEAGSAHEIDPKDLGTIGLKAYSPDTAGVPFSAHPRVEPDGTLWNFGYLSGADTIVLWHIDSRGALVKTGLVKAHGITMIHDCIVTERSLVLLVPPFTFEAGSGATFLDMHHWQAGQPARVLVVDKDDFSKYRWFELPPQWVFHFGNAWEVDGVIHFDAARAPDASAVYGSLRTIMRGERGTAGESHATHHAYQVDTRTGRVRETPMLDGLASEFPNVDARVCGRRHTQTFMLAAASTSGSTLATVARLHLGSGDLQQYRYGPTEHVEEHIYVPDPTKPPEKGGWVLGTTLDYGAMRDVPAGRLAEGIQAAGARNAEAGRAFTRLNIFEAERIEDGPVAVVQLPYALPLGLHGKFVPHA